jgi:hypothetical protein
MPTRIEYNCSTGIQTEVELTAEEITQIENDRLAADADLSSIRNERNGKLTKSDWTQTSDSPLTDSKKVEWATYRQELRDFPVGKTKVSEFSVDSDGRMIWPTEPS